MVPRVSDEPWPRSRLKGGGGTFTAVVLCNAVTLRSSQDRWYLKCDVSHISADIMQSAVVPFLVASQGKVVIASCAEELLGASSPPKSCVSSTPHRRIAQNLNVDGSKKKKNTKAWKTSQIQLRGFDTSHEAVFGMSLKCLLTRGGHVTSPLQVKMPRSAWTEGGRQNILEESNGNINHSTNNQTKSKRNSGR